MEPLGYFSVLPAEAIAQILHLLPTMDLVLLAKCDAFRPHLAHVRSIDSSEPIVITVGLALVFLQAKTTRNVLVDVRIKGKDERTPHPKAEGVFPASVDVAFIVKRRNEKLIEALSSSNRKRVYRVAETSSPYNAETFGYSIIDKRERGKKILLSKGEGPDLPGRHIVQREKGDGYGVPRQRALAELPNLQQTVPSVKCKVVLTTRFYDLFRDKILGLCDPHEPLGPTNRPLKEVLSLMDTRVSTKDTVYFLHLIHSYVETARGNRINHEPTGIDRFFLLEAVPLEEIATIEVPGPILEDKVQEDERRVTRALRKYVEGGDVYLEDTPVISKVG